MRKIHCTLFCAIILASVSAICYAQPVSSTVLINNAKDYDGKPVAYEGEAIGDIMKRGGYSWVNVNDGVNAIGIWVENSLRKDIAYTGTYKSKGDWLEISGVFHRACPEHGGDLDIHAQAIRKINSGCGISHKLNIDKRNLAAVLLGILGITWILTRLIKQ